MQHCEIIHAANTMCDEECGKAFKNEVPDTIIYHTKNKIRDVP